MTRLAVTILLVVFVADKIAASDRDISNTDWHKHAVAYYADVEMSQELRKHLLNDQIIPLNDKDGSSMGWQYNLLDLTKQISKHINESQKPAAVIFLGDGYGGEAFRFHAHHPETPIFTCDIKQHILQGLIDLLEIAKKSDQDKQKKMAQNLTASVADATELYKNNDFRQFLVKTQGMRKYVAAFNLFHQMKPSDIFVLIHNMGAILNRFDRMFVIFDSIMPYDQFIEYLKKSPIKTFSGGPNSASAFIMSKLIEEQGYEGYAFPGYANKPLTGKNILHGGTDICYIPGVYGTWVSEVFADAGFSIVQDKLKHKSANSRVYDWETIWFNYNLNCGRFFEIMKDKDRFAGDAREIMQTMHPKIAKVANADTGLVKFFENKTITYGEKPPFLELSSQEH